MTREIKENKQKRKAKSVIRKKKKLGKKEQYKESYKEMASDSLRSSSNIF